MYIMTNQMTLKELAEKIGGNYWEKGDLKRIYLDKGWNTKKMSTKTFVWQDENGNFKVSCRIECDSQAFNWIKSQEEEVKESVWSSIEEALADTVYFFVDKDGNPLNESNDQVALNDLYDSDYFFSVERAEEVFDNEYRELGSSIKEMPKAEFESEVERLDEIQRQKWAEERVAKKEVATTVTKDKPVANNNYKAETFGVGSQVSHARFGIGTVVFEDENTAKIQFPEHREKSLLKKFAKLERVEA